MRIHAPQQTGERHCVAWQRRITVLSACLLLGWLLAQKIDEGPVSRIVIESFLIFGWVAIWKPSEIFLYAPPLARRRKLFRRLSEATVVLDVEASTS
jgi:hypothetical protein